MKSNHENIQLFEQLVAEYAGANYAVAVDCCSHALYLSLKYLQQKKVKVPYIEIPKMTYVSVPMMAIHAGYKIKFVDREWSGTYQLHPVPVIDSACRFTSDMYVPDTYYCLSFNSKKILSTGKGGMILTNDKKAVKWMRQARFVGRESERYFDIKDVSVLGWHMHMTPEIAARGVEQFYSLSKHNSDFGSSSGRLDLSRFSIFKDYHV